MGFTPPLDSYRLLFASMVRAAFNDVRAFCSLKRRPLRATQRAVCSLAWLLGVAKSPIMIETACDVLGVRWGFLFDRIERMVDGPRYWELRNIVTRTYRVGGVA